MGFQSRWKNLIDCNIGWNCKSLGCLHSKTHLDFEDHDVTVTDAEFSPGGNTILTEIFINSFVLIHFIQT